MHVLRSLCTPRARRPRRAFPPFCLELIATATPRPQLMDQMKDNLLIVMLGKAHDDAAGALFASCKSKAAEIAMHAGVPQMRTAVELVRIPNDFELDSGLIYLANHHASGSTVLVIGAAGKGLDDASRGKKRPEGQPPMGQLAKMCVQKCKVPVVTVKSGGHVRPLRGPPRERIGRSGEKGLNIMTCVDVSPVSHAAFDLMTMFFQPGDRVHAFHVHDSEHASITSGLDLASVSLKAMYTNECEKITAATKGAVEAQLHWINKAGGKSIREHIERFVDDNMIDVIIMGSVVLSDPKGLQGARLLGSVASAVAKSSLAHCVIVKNFTTTTGAR